MKMKRGSLKVGLGVWLMISVVVLLPACGTGSGGGGDGGNSNVFRFTSVPEYGTSENLHGSAGSYSPEDHMVAVYIKVEGGWWTKPYFNLPLTSINSDGFWTCDITTGGNDRYASHIAAFLLPVGVDPPSSSGSTKFPEIPEAVEVIIVNRLGEERDILFSGINWIVKQSDFRVGPGPNYFSDDENKVWVDSEGLHLTIQFANGVWNCTEVIADESYGYGTYIFETSGRVDTINPRMVLGAFTWNTDDPDNAYTEIDAVEYARWGDANEFTNGQFVVHPASICPGSPNCSRFRVDLSDDDSALTHYMVWSEGVVEFWVYYGHHIDGVPSESDLVHQWTFVGDNVPEPSGENFRFNFWLINGLDPTDGQGDELVINNFLWDEVPFTGGESDEFRFTSVPPRGSTANLMGDAGPYDPAAYKIAVYIKVAGGWWTKPYFNLPLTSISSGGFWTCDITTGGNDTSATDIAAFMLPTGVDPPSSSGSGQFPSIPEAVEVITVNRP